MKLNQCHGIISTFHPLLHLKIKVSIVIHDLKKSTDNKHNNNWHRCTLQLYSYFELSVYKKQDSSTVKV